MADSSKHPFIQIRLTHYEAKIISEIRSKYRISARQIWEIVQNCGCQEGTITAYVEQGRIKGKGTKKVEIPRHILCRK